jgi:glucose-1-phosphate adenylyltransferase
MFILPGSIYGLKNVQGKFLLRDIIQNRPFLDRDTAELVVVSGCNKIFNIDFRAVAETHTETGADITLIYKKSPVNPENKGLNLDLDDSGRVHHISHSAASEGNCFMDAFIINRELLLKIIGCYEETSYLDLTDIITENLSALNIKGYEFKGYMGKVDSIKSYFKCNQDLLNPEIKDELFIPERPIITKIQDSPPAKYSPSSDVKNSLVSSGCIIKGEIRNSIIFRGVTVEEGARINNCVIMQNSVVSKNAALENVICDKYVNVREAVRLYGNAIEPILVGKGQKV